MSMLIIIEMVFPSSNNEGQFKVCVTYTYRYVVVRSTSTARILVIYGMGGCCELLA